MAVHLRSLGPFRQCPQLLIIATQIGTAHMAVTPHWQQHALFVMPITADSILTIAVAITQALAITEIFIAIAALFSALKPWPSTPSKFCHGDKDEYSAMD